MADWTAPFSGLSRRLETLEDTSRVSSFACVLAPEFGAFGDNAADDAAALQRAINKAGKGVEIPEGIYRAEGAITIRGSKDIRGVATRLNAISDLTGSCIRRIGTGPLVIIEPDSEPTGVGIFIRGLHLRGDGVNPVVDANNFNKLHFEDCIFYNPGAVGVLLSKTAYATFKNCRFEQCSYGVYSQTGVGEYCNAIRMSDCEFACSLGGVDISGGGLEFTGCTFEGGLEGARISAKVSTASQGVVFSGCYFEGSTTRCLNLGYASGVRGVVVSGCFFSAIVGTPTDYIAVAGQGIDIRGNAFYGIAGSPARKIYVVNSSNVRLDANNGIAEDEVELDNSTDVTFGGGGTSEDLVADGDNIVNVYVNSATGSDSNTGSASAPFATIQKAGDRYNAWLALAKNEDFRIHLSAHVYLEAPVITLSHKPLGRFGIRGATMGVLASGTTTAGNATTITDGGATFGTNRELVGYPAKIWDPADEANTTSWIQVGDHTNTVLSLAGDLNYSSVPGAGWRYEVYRPATRINSTALAQPSLVFAGLNASIRSSISDSNTTVALSPGIGGGVLIENIEFIRDDVFSETSVLLSHATVAFMACVGSGRAQCVVMNDGQLILGGVYDYVDNTFLGVTALNFNKYFLSFGALRGSFGGVPAILGKRSVVVGNPVVWGSHALHLEDGYGLIGFSFFHVGELGLYEGSWARIGTMVFKDTAVSRGAIQLGSEVFGGPNCAEIWGPVTIDGALEDGIRVTQFSTAWIQDVTTGAGGIAGYALVVGNGSHVTVDSESTWTATTGEISIDGSTRTWADLRGFSPLQGTMGSSIGTVYDWNDTPPLGEFVADANGIIHAYVDATGLDTDDGIVTRPWATVQHACKRLERLLGLGPPDHDIIIHFDGDVFAEAVTFRPPVMPRRRIIFEGDKAAMTVVATGTTTAGDAITITDGGAAFGVDALVGYPVKVFNPADEAGTFSWTTVAAHTATVIRFSGGLEYATVPGAGWTYTVYRPASRIDGTGLGITFNMHLPQAGTYPSGVNNDEGAPWVSGGNGVIFRWIEFIRNDTYDLTGVMVSGGTVSFSGCVISGASRALMTRDSDIWAGYLFPDAAADPALGFAGYEYSTWTCTFGVRRTGGGIGAVYIDSSTFNGFLAILTTSHGFWALNSNIQINDGAINHGEMAFYQNSCGRISNLVLKNTPANQPGIKLGYPFFWGGVHMEVFNATFDGCSGPGIQVNMASFLSIVEGGVSGGLVTGAGGIAGWALEVSDGGRVAIGDNACTALTATTGQVTVDAGTEVLFADIVVGAPVIGTNTGARVWRNPPE